MPDLNQTPEQKARDTIDLMLVDAGCVVQLKERIDLGMNPGITSREYKTDVGPADYELFIDDKPASKEAWTKEVWIYDYRTNIHHTLKKKPMTLDDLKEFIELYSPGNRHKRTETWSEENPDGRWRKFSYEEILERDKTNLDIFWLKDKSLTDLENLPDPDVLAEEIIVNLESGLESFRGVLEQLLK